MGTVSTRRCSSSIYMTSAGAGTSQEAETAEAATVSADDSTGAAPAGGGGSSSSSKGRGEHLQAAHQRLCAVLLVKLMRRLVELDPHQLAAQLARRAASPCVHAHIAAIAVIYHMGSVLSARECSWSSTLTKCMCTYCH